MWVGKPACSVYLQTIKEPSVEALGICGTGNQIQLISCCVCVCVCGCYYTGEQANRESDLGIQSSFLPKSIDIACKVMLNV